MSYSITGTTITLTRGDTFEALVSATKKDGTPYIPVEGDVIRFAMKENYDDARPLLVKEIPIDTMMLMLEPSDTADLNFGKYVYDIQLTKANGKVDTFLKAKVNAAAEGNHSHANKTVLDSITSEKVAAWDAAEQNAKNYVDGLVASNNEVTAICTEVFGTAST